MIILHKVILRIFMVSIALISFIGCEDGKDSINGIDGINGEDGTDGEGGFWFDDFPDVPNGINVTKGAYRKNWNRNYIYYYYTNGTSDINGDLELSAIEEAFSLWETVIPVRFTRVLNSKYKDIEIGFYPGVHTGPNNDDGFSNNTTLAHAGYSGNYIHFNDDKTWSNEINNSSGEPIDLVTVAVHEIGHALGLDHTSSIADIMYPRYTGSQRFLSFDDISDIQSLYGSNDEFISYPEDGEEFVFGNLYWNLEWNKEYLNSSTVRIQAYRRSFIGNFGVYFRYRYDIPVFDQTITNTGFFEYESESLEDSGDYLVILSTSNHYDEVYFSAQID
ncbi:matrixin family metalloprotease [Aquimarina muelleri]|uniref:Peptidase metallopeptidase domain-containing protein n=1 Tax=Aquimarina muelleri TaxID=279356 RepID=A0A918JR52_9FLAO|nr:matrixin family metalloprotease [Aquimarina muelleri]MCX2762095.1 M10 family metallopeptidase domain-containing protein [Aquimarina muelleri]GGX04426.1 hypothetical protein GCM10007384_02770 [Aquimarina muelleri]